MPGLREHLKRFIPPLFARQDDLSGAWRTLGVYGPGAESALRDVLGVAPRTAAEDAFVQARFAEADLIAVRTFYAGVPGLDVFGPATAVNAVRAALLEQGVTPAGQEALETLRIEAGRPRWGAELDEGVIPLEAGLRQRAISETKGCYTGQEVIVRILHRGHVNRHLRGLLVGTVAPPAPGAQLRQADGRVVGHVTSARVSPRLGQTIALAYVRREVVPPAVLMLSAAGPGDVVAHVVELPFELPGSASPPATAPATGPAAPPAAPTPGSAPSPQTPQG
jgi:folate-binding protein YgfZ